MMSSLSLSMFEIENIITRMDSSISQMRTVYNVWNSFTGGILP